MTKDEVSNLMKEAGPLVKMPFDQWCERFAALVAEREREACAALAEKTICDKHIPTGVSIYGTRAAKAIRARGTT